MRELNFELIEAFAGAIDSGAEHAIHAFIETNPQVLSFLCWDGVLKSKLRLAGRVLEEPIFLGDPRSQVLTDPQSLNSYSYANDNPISKSDPTGRVR
jgi:hypothetical protein